LLRIAEQTGKVKVFGGHICGEEITRSGIDDLSGGLICQRRRLPKRTELSPGRCRRPGISRAGSVQATQDGNPSCHAPSNVLSVSEEHRLVFRRIVLGVMTTTSRMRRTCPRLLVHSPSHHFCRMLDSECLEVVQSKANFPCYLSSEISCVLSDNIDFL
jgi:hypothetical protein